MKLTERDKILLFILGILIILFVPFYFIVRPISELSDTLETEVAELEGRKRELENLFLRKEEFEESIQTAALEREELIGQFPAEISQEGLILFLNRTEKLIPITLSQSSFEEEVSVPISDGDIQSEDANSSEVTENADGSTTDTSTDPAIDSALTASDLMGLFTGSNIIYSGKYKNFKDFLNYILQYKDRMVISNLTAIYSSELDIVTGNLTLEQYGITGEGRIAPKITEPNLPKGTSNVFMQATGIAASQSGENASDFFLMLSQPEADGEAIIFGQSMDGTRETYLTSETNDLQEAAISFRGSDGNYIANYQIGDVKYSDSGEGISFDKDGNIVFEVISSKRVGDKDQVGVRLSVINKSDRIVNVTVRNDDKEAPRVTITGKTGDVSVE